MFETFRFIHAIFVDQQLIQQISKHLSFRLDFFKGPFRRTI